MHINVNDHSFPISPPSPVFMLDESLGWLLTASGWPARMGRGRMMTGTCEGLGLRSDPRRSLSPSLGEFCFFALWAMSLQPRVRGRPHPLSSGLLVAGASPGAPGGGGTFFPSASAGVVLPFGQIKADVCPPGAPASC